MESSVISIDYQCAVERTIAVLHGRWKPLILYNLLGGTKRFGELQRLLSHVTKRMLTQHLRELEQDGIVSRRVYEQIPPRVEYSLTPTGRTLESILLAMQQWGSTHLTQLPMDATPPPGCLPEKRRFLIP